MNPVDNIFLAFHALNYQRKRAVITMLIISIGITALVGIFSAIEALRRSVEVNFSEAGANTFNIEPKWQGRSRFRTNRVIRYNEALEFKRKFSAKTLVSIKASVKENAVVRYKNKKSNPNTEILGVDENYLLVSGNNLSEGRMFSAEEVQSGKAVVIIGEEIKKFLFPNQNPIHKNILVGNLKFNIVGVLKSKGAGLGFGGDRLVLIPLQTARQYYVSANQNFEISCFVNEIKKMEIFMEEAVGYFRSVRKLSVRDENDFEITRSDNLVNLVMKDISMITGGASFIGAITLFGAGIGLMNIMLISVQERTREIGIRKALGATRRDISLQFLAESVVIGLLGGVIGIVLGVIIGNVVSILLSSGLFIPWKWVFGGTFICFMVGIFSGWIPASKAASVDPIESLRYE
jgi:putative ABC transport system permease protein